MKSWRGVSLLLGSLPLAAAALLLGSCANVLGLGDYKNLCGQDLDQPCTPGQGGGGGSGPSCHADGDCPGTGSDCSTPHCGNGTCTPKNLARGASCASDGGSVCDGAGQCVECLSSGDCGHSDTTCLTFNCTGTHTCTMKEADFGVPCADHGGEVCDGKGKCAGCNSAADCHSDTMCQVNPSCDSHTCTFSPAAAGTACTDHGGHVCDAEGRCFSVTSVAAGAEHGCALTSVGSVKCWGSQQFGELGDGTTTPHYLAIDVPGLSSGVKAITSGYYFTCALMNGGGVKCWGENMSGELGDGTTTNRHSPVDVVGLSGITSVVTSPTGDHTCAITSAGGLMCWGYNGSGQVGDGTTMNQTMPVAVPSLTSGVTAVTPGTTHTCATKTGGMLVCWGGNSHGQLGDGTTMTRPMPVPLAGPNITLGVSTCGDAFSCATGMNGKPFCWGDNQYGQLGTGDFVERHAPFTVQDFAGGYSQIVSGDGHVCVLTPGNGVKCWGYDAEGQLGDGGGTNKNAPVDVVGLSTGVVNIAAGVYNTCAVMAAGGVKCWGDNALGALGDGTTTSSSTPVDVAGL